MPQADQRWAISVGGSGSGGDGDLDGRGAGEMTSPAASGGSGVSAAVRVRRAVDVAVNPFTRSARLRIHIQDPRARRAGLLGPIQRQARVATSTMSTARSGGPGRRPRAARPDRHIRLGLGQLGRAMELYADRARRAELFSQGFATSSMPALRAALGLPDDYWPPMSLEALARLEHAPVDQLFVLDPFPASSAGGCRAHGQRLPGESRPVNVSRPRQRREPAARSTLRGSS